MQTKALVHPTKTLAMKVPHVHSIFYVGLERELVSSMSLWRIWVFLMKSKS